MGARSKSMDAAPPPDRLMAVPPSAIARTALPADRIKALEALVEDLRAAIRERDDRIARQDNELKYRAKRLADAGLLSASSSSPRAGQAAEATVVHRRSSGPSKPIQAYPAAVR